MYMTEQTKQAIKDAIAERKAMVEHLQKTIDEHNKLFTPKPKESK